MSLKPSHLPKVRDQTLAHLDDPTASVRARTGEHSAPFLDAAANHMRTGGLYWVSANMTALAVSAGAKLDAARWATADRPAPSGLIVFDEGAGFINDLYPVDACTWGPGPDGCYVTLWVLRKRVAEIAARNGTTVLTDLVPPLMPIGGYAPPVTADAVPWQELHTDTEGILRTLAAAWLLMRQPKLVDRTQMPADKAVGRSYARRQLTAPDVTIVDLRHEYTPQDRDHDSNDDGRTYRNRWVVSGHWRRYTHDRYSPELRAEPQWIPDHIKGPDGAPFLVTEKVNVWRR